MSEIRTHFVDDLAECRTHPLVQRLPVGSLMPDHGGLEWGNVHRYLMQPELQGGLAAPREPGGHGAQQCRGRHDLRRQQDGVHPSRFSVPSSFASVGAALSAARADLEAGDIFPSSLLDKTIEVLSSQR